MTYIKLMEMTSVDDTVDSPQETHLQHVDVVDVVDQDGNPWYPPVELEWGVQWITTEPFIELTTATARTATFTGGSDAVIYRHRLQTRPTGDTAQSNGSWTNYDNTGQDVDYVLPASGVDVRFQAQAKDGDTVLNSFSGWKEVVALTPPT